MTFVRCPNCQQAYSVRRRVDYADPFVCAVCGLTFFYGGAAEARAGAKVEKLRLPGTKKVLSRASSRMPTIRPPAPLRDISFEPDYDTRRLAELLKLYPTVLPPVPPEPMDDAELARLAALGTHAVFVDGRLFAEDVSQVAPEDLPEGWSEWSIVAGRQISSAVKRTVSPSVIFSRRKPAWSRQSDQTPRAASSRYSRKPSPSK